MFGSKNKVKLEDLDFTAASDLIDDLPRGYKKQNKKLIEQVKEKDPVAVYEIGGFWGDRIQWQNVEKRQVVGWKRRRPNEYDLLMCEMQSGKTGVFTFVDVEYLNNPPDMFFGKVLLIGYKGVGE